MRKKELFKKYIEAEKEITTLKMESSWKSGEIDKLSRDWYKSDCRVKELEKECAKYKKQAEEAKNNVDKVLEDYKQYQANKLKLNAVMGEDEEDDEGIAIGDFVGSLG